MSHGHRVAVVVSSCLVLLGAQLAGAQDWPQWRGAGRDARATGFEAPEKWPEALTEQWKVSVGDGVATPALLEGKLYVFTMQDGNEVLRCLDADTGKELWQEKSAAQGAKLTSVSSDTAPG